MQRPAQRNVRRRASQQPVAVEQANHKKANYIKTRMQSRNELPCESRRPMKFANHTNLPHAHLLLTKQNLSRSEEDTKVTEQDDSSEEALMVADHRDTQAQEGGSAVVGRRELEAYGQEIRAYVLAREEKYMIEHGYLRHHRVVGLKFRSYLVRYIFRISLKHSLLRTTLYLAVHYLDLYFSRVFNLRDQAEAVAIAQACLFIAMKYEEIYPPELSEWIDRRSIPDILRLEAEVLRALDFQLAHYTLEHFLQFQLWQNAPADCQALPVAADRTLLLMDLSLFDLPMRQFRPSELAGYLRAMGEGGEEAERQDRLIAKNVVWMVERNKEALNWLLENKYRGADGALLP